MRSDIFITSHYTLYTMITRYVTVNADLVTWLKLYFLGSSTAKLSFVSPLSLCALEGNLYLSPQNL